MAARPTPEPNAVMVRPDGRPAEVWYLYFKSRELKPLIDAVNDAAAAAAGVAINEFYRNGSVVMVRVT